MNFENSPARNESVSQGQEKVTPKNKFMELWKFAGRRTESAQKTSNERNVKTAVGYDGALTVIHSKLELAYFESRGKGEQFGDEIDREAFAEFVNSLSVEQLEKQIDLIEARWEGSAEAKMEDGKKDEADELYRAIDSLLEIRNGLV
jgi:hypothetical protein